MTAEGAVLHDRSTRGEKLTAHEQQLLDAWYREQDQAELTLLAQGVLATDVVSPLNSKLARILWRENRS